MSRQSLPVLETILKSWTDAFRAIRDMPVVAACGFVILAAVSVGVYLAAGEILRLSGRSVEEWVSSPAWLVFGVFHRSVLIALLVPLFMAVHRYVINGQRARLYPLNPLRPSYLRYAGMALAAYFVFRLPEILNVMSAPARGFLPFDLLLWLLTVGSMITIAVVVVSRMSLFPAIAVNAPGANWSDTPSTGPLDFLRIAVILSGILGPGQIGAWLVQGYVPAPLWPSGNGGIVPTLAMTVVEFPMMCALAAAMARIYLGLKAPAGQAATSTNQPALA